MKQNKKGLNFAIGGIAAGIAILCFAGGYFFNKKESVVVLNPEVIRRESVLFQKIAIEQEKYETYLKTQVMVLQNILETDAKKFNEKKKTLSKKEIEKEEKALNEKATVLQQKYQAEVARITTISQKAATRMDELLNETADEFTKQNGYGILLLKNMTFFTRPCVDVTADFVRLFNEKTVSVSFTDLIVFSENQEQSQLQKEEKKGTLENQDSADQKVRQLLQKEESK